LPALEPISFDNQISCEIISPIDENNFYLVCLYVKIEIIEGKTNYKIYGNVEQKEYYIFSSNIETDINVLKIDSNTLRCISKKQITDVQIKKENGEIIIYNTQNGYSNDYGLYSYNNGFIFALDRYTLRIYKDLNSNYYEFENYSILNRVIKILGIYNQINNYFLVYFKSGSSIKYISLKNCTNYLSIQTNSLKYLMKHESSYNFNISKLISTKNDFGRLEESYFRIGGSLSEFNFYKYNTSIQILSVYSDPSNYGTFSFAFALTSESNGFKIMLKPEPMVNITFGLCSFSCDACFFNYKYCSLIVFSIFYRNRRFKIILQI
jgi:hypothetical protein